MFWNGVSVMGHNSPERRVRAQAVAPLNWYAFIRPFSPHSFMSVTVISSVDPLATAMEQSSLAVAKGSTDDITVTLMKL